MGAEWPTLEPGDGPVSGDYVGAEWPTLKPGDGPVSSIYVGAESLTFKSLEPGGQICDESSSRSELTNAVVLSDSHGPRLPVSLDPSLNCSVASS